MAVETKQGSPIIGRYARPGISVPVDVIEDRRLSATARLVLVYLIGLTSRPGWTVYIGQVQAALGLGKDAWVNARRQLEQLGYYQSERQRRDDGTMCWVHVVTDPPASAAQSTPPYSARKTTIPGKPGDGSTGGGSAGGGAPGDIRTKKERSNKTSTTTDVASDETELVFPQGLTAKEAVVVEKLISELPSDARQDVLDELAGALLKAGTIRTSPASYLRALARKANAGEFHPSLGMQVAARRQRLQQESEKRRIQELEREKRYRESNSESGRAAFKECLTACAATLGTSVAKSSASSSKAGCHQGDPVHAAAHDDAAWSRPAGEQ